jgi:CheY-like chemotaxis protein
MTAHQKKPRVLIIDDEPVIQNLMTDLLTADGYEVFIATDGLEGVAKATQNDFDIIFSDIHMPNMNGLETMRKIKELKPHSIFVVMCSYIDNVSEEAIKEVAIAILEKPFNIADVTSLAEDIIHSSSAA